MLERNYFAMQLKVVLRYMIGWIKLQGTHL